jgi:hypothetical protein
VSAGWNINQGITDSEIDMLPATRRQGHRVRPDHDGGRAYYDYVAQNGGIDGRDQLTARMISTPAATKTNPTRRWRPRSTPPLTLCQGTLNNLGIWDDTNRSACPAPQRHRRAAVGRHREPP